MSTGLHKSLEETIDHFAVAAGHRTAQAVINRVGKSKPERGKVLAFEPRRYWIEKD